MCAVVVCMVARLVGGVSELQDSPLPLYTAYSLVPVAVKQWFWPTHVLLWGSSTGTTTSSRSRLKECVPHGMRSMCQSEASHGHKSVLLMYKSVFVGNVWQGPCMAILQRLAVP